LVKAIIAGDYTAAWEAAGQIASGYADWTIATFTGLKTTVEMIFSTMADAINNTIENLRLGATIDFQRIRNAVTTATDSARSAVTSAWDGAKATLSGIWESMRSAAVSVFAGIRGAMDGIIAAKDAVVGAFTTLKDFVGGLSIPNPFSGIASSLEGLIGLANRAKDALGGVGSGGGSTARNAAGTDFFRGGMSTINERGTELIALPGRNRNVWLPRGSAIYSAERSPMLAGGGGVTVNVYANVNNGMDAESLAYQIAGILRRNQR
jgi:phage-related protein